MDQITEQITNFVCNFSLDEMPSALLTAAEDHLVDSIGCAVAGKGSRPVQMALQVGGLPSSLAYEGGILFQSERMSLDQASFVNACMIRALDFNDRYPGGHPSDCLGAILAFAIGKNLSGSCLLKSMIVTYEIFARLSDAAMLSRKGWDQGFVVGLSTAGGLCNLLCLSPEKVANAIGMIASNGVPFRVTRAGELSEWKNVATPFAVRNAAFLTLMAECGLEGPSRPFEGRNGLFENITGAFSIKPFPGFGGDVMTPSVQLKYWPVETNAQPVVWAALDLRSQVDVADITSIDVFTNKFTVFEIASEPPKWDPQTRETADHSLPYIMARSLVDGPLTESSFSLSAVRDPSLRPLMNLIKVSVDPLIDALPSGEIELRLVVSLRNGKKLEILTGNPLGHPAKPMSRSDVSDKFLRLSQPVFGEVMAGKLLSDLWDVSNSARIGSLLDGYHAG